MHPELKAYLDEFEAKAQARYDASARLLDALLSKLITGASTPQPAGSAVVASEDGLTHDTLVPAVVPDVFFAPSYTSKAQEVLELIPNASPACIVRAPVICSTDGSNQVLTGVSTSQPVRPMGTPADGGLTDEASVPAVVPDIFSSTQVEEPSTVDHDAPSVCIEMVPITCSTEYLTQVASITSVDEVHGAATAGHPQPVVDLIHQEAVSEIDPKTSLSEQDHSPLPSINTSTQVVSEADHIVVLLIPSNLAAPAPSKCLAECPAYMGDLVNPLTVTADSADETHETVVVARLQPPSFEHQPWPLPVQVQFNHMGSLFRPSLWPSFRLLLVTIYLDEPCSSIHGQSHGAPCFSPWLIRLTIRDVPREDPGNGTDADSSGTDPAKTALLRNASVNHDEKEDASRTNGTMCVPSQVFPTELGLVRVSQDINALSRYGEEREQTRDASAAEMIAVRHADNFEEDLLTGDTGSGEVRTIQSKEKIHAKDQPEDRSPISNETGRSGWDLAFLKLFVVQNVQIKFKGSMSKTFPWPSFDCFHSAVWSELPNCELPADYYSSVTICRSPVPISVDDLSASEFVEPLFLIIHEQVGELGSSFCLEELWDARNSVYKIQEQGNFCEHHVLEHATVCNTHRPGKLQEAMQIMSMSVGWSFLRLEEFQGSGRFDRGCSSEQCSDPCVLVACLMVEPIVSVHKRGVPTNAVKSKIFKGNLFLCSSINLVSLASSILITLEQFSGKNCYELPRVEFQSSIPDFSDAIIMRESWRCFRSAQRKPCRSSIRYMGHPFRPKPWPAFNCHSDVCCTEEPCSGIYSQPHEVSWFSYGLLVFRFRDVASLPAYYFDLIPMEEPFTCFQHEGLPSASGMAEVDGALTFPNVNHHESLCKNATVTNLKLQFTDCPIESMRFSLLAHKEDGQQHVSKLFQLIRMSDVEDVPRSIFTLQGCHSADFYNTTSTLPPYKTMQQGSGVSSYDSPGYSFLWCEGLWTSEIARKNNSKGLLPAARPNQSVDMRKYGIIS